MPLGRESAFGDPLVSPHLGEFGLYDAEAFGSPAVLDLPGHLLGELPATFREVVFPGG